MRENRRRGPGPVGWWEGAEISVRSRPYAVSHSPQGWNVVAPGDTLYKNLTNSSMAQWLFDGLPNYWVAETGCGDHETTPPYKTGINGPFWSDSAAEGYRYAQRFCCKPTIDTAAPPADFSPISFPSPYWAKASY